MRLKRVVLRSLATLGVIWLGFGLGQGPVHAAAILTGPHWEQAASNAVLLQWTTDVPTRGRVQYGLGLGQLTQRVEGPVTNRHAIWLRDLSPNTRYHFVVGTARQTLATNSFTTASPQVSGPARMARPTKTTTAEFSTQNPAPPARETWGNWASLRDHFDRHGGDFGARTPEDYARLAWEFLQRARVEGWPAKVDAEGVLRVFASHTPKNR